MASSNAIMAKLLRDADGNPLITSTEQGDKYVFDAGDNNILMDVSDVDLTKRFELRSLSTADGIVNVFLDMNVAESPSTSSTNIAKPPPASSITIAESPSASSTNTAESVEATPAEWTDAATKLLITTYEQKLTLLKQRKIKSKKFMYRAIADVLNFNKYPFTDAQVLNKWKSLERAYKTKVDNNCKSGRGRKTCPYEVELERILGQKRSVVPEVTIGMSTTVTRVEVNSTAGETPEQLPQAEFQTPPGQEKENTPRQLIPPIKRRRLQPERDVQLILQEIREDRESRQRISDEQNRLELIKIELFQKILDKL